MKSNITLFQPGVITLALLPFSSYAVSPWHFDDGQSHEITSGYLSVTKNDIPILVSGNNTIAKTNSPDYLNFSTASAQTDAVKLEKGAALSLYRSSITTGYNKSKGIHSVGSSMAMGNGKIATMGDDATGIVTSRGYLNLDNTSLSTTGNWSNGIISHGTNINLNDVSIDISGKGSTGIDAHGGSLYFSGNLHIKSDAHEGISVENTYTKLNKTSITLDNTAYLYKSY